MKYVFVFLFVVMVVTSRAFAQHQHGEENGGNVAKKQFSFGNISVEYSVKPYPLERGKKHVFFVKVLNISTQQTAADTQVSLMLHPQKERKDGMEEKSFALNPSDEPALFTAEFVPDRAGEYSMMLEIKTSDVNEPLTFTFSETVNEKQNFMEKMMNKGMKMHHKMHTNLLLLGIMGAAMLLGHSIVH